MSVLENNTRVSKYKVVSLIKNNQYTETYKAVDEDDNPYFLKLFILSQIHPKLVNPETKAVKEIEYSRLIKHRNIISYVDGGEIETTLGICQYYITPFISGCILSDYVAQKGHLDENEAKRIFLSILEGLSFLHTLSPALCHNDLDPSNIMLSAVTNNEPQIIDLGHLSERCSGSVKFDVSDIDILYHCNENMVGIFDEQGDIFSACAILYFMLTGSAPWKPELDNSLEYKQKFHQLTRYRIKNALDIDGLQVSDKIKTVLKIGLELKYTERAKSVEELQSIFVLEKSKNKTQEQIGKGALSKESRGFDRGNGHDEIPNPNHFVLDIKRGGGGGFADIAGMSELKEFLRSKLIFILNNKELAEEYCLSAPNGMLLYGPPGCGKTYFAEKFAEETNFNFALIKSSDLASSFLHGSQEKIGKLFSQAEQNSPIVLCFDEFDALVPDRSLRGMEQVSSEVNEFLSQMNNCSKRGIFIVATTNRPDKIDPAVLRTGRIDRLVYVPLPDFEARKEMFALYLKRRPLEDDIDFDNLAKLTEGYIASDIAYIVNDSAMTAAYSRVKISYQQLLASINSIPPSIREDSKVLYESIRERMDASNRKNVVPRRRIGY